MRAPGVTLYKKMSFNYNKTSVPLKKWKAASNKSCFSLSFFWYAHGLQWSVFRKKKQQKKGCGSFSLLAWIGRGVGRDKPSPQCQKNLEHPHIAPSVGLGWLNHDLSPQFPEPDTSLSSTSDIRWHTLNWNLATSEAACIWIACSQKMSSAVTLFSAHWMLTSPTWAFFIFPWPGC